jgi:hypothetical protein
MRWVVAYTCNPRYTGSSVESQFEASLGKIVHRTSLNQQNLGAV